MRARRLLVPIGLALVITGIFLVANTRSPAPEPPVTVDRAFPQASAGDSAPTARSTKLLPPLARRGFGTLGPTEGDALVGENVLARPLTERHTWRDGSGTHTVWLDPQRVVVFGRDAQVVEVSGTGEAVFAREGMCVLRVLDDAQGTREWADCLGAAEDAHASPVFHALPHTGGEPLALPGGVHLQMAPGTPRTSVEALAASAGLGEVEALAYGTDLYRVGTAAGLAALEAAEALGTDAEVLWCAPDWWRGRRLAWR